MKKNVFALFFSVIMLTGCTTTGNNSRENAPTPNAIGLCLTDEEADNANFGMMQYGEVLLNQNLITETEMGYYYQIYGLYDTWLDARPLLMYADKETGTQTALCPKPECTHDGNLFCTASTFAYEHGSITYADGKL